MKFGKDDPLYYRESMKKLLKEAEENGITLLLINNVIMFRIENETFPDACEQTSVNLSTFCKLVEDEKCVACDGSGRYASTKCGSCGGSGKKSK